MAEFNKSMSITVIKRYHMTKRKCINNIYIKDESINKEPTKKTDLCG